MGIVALLGVAGYLYLRIDDETRWMAQRALSKACAPLEVRVGGARFSAGHGVSMFEVEFFEPRPNGSAVSVLRIDELRLEGRFDIASLLRASPEIERVVVRRPKVALTRRIDGTWNLPRLKLPQPNGRRPPRIEIQNASLLLRDASNPAAQPILLQEITATCAPTATNEPSQFDCTAQMAGSIAKEIRFSGKIDTSTGGFQCQATIDQAQLTNELIAAMPRHLPTRRAIPSLRGKLTATLSASRLQRGTPLDWRAAFRITEGELHLPQLRRPLTRIETTGECGPMLLQIDQANAQWGETQVVATVRREGWHAAAPLALRCRLAGLETSALPVESLPPSLQCLWERFRPEGVADLAVDATFDGARWAPRATLQFRDMAFEDSEKFPYRLTGGVGRMDLLGGVEPTPTTHGSDKEMAPVAIDLTAFIEGTPVRIAARFHEPPLVCVPCTEIDGKKRMPPGSLEVTGVGLPITSRIIDALPDARAREVIRSLHPSGRVDLRWRIERPSREATELETTLDLRLADCLINYERFPYPLTGVTGWVRQRNQHWTFTELESRDARGRLVVSGAGSLGPSGGGSRFELKLHGTEVPLDERLHAALPAEAQGAWDFLRPRGSLDFETTITTEPGAHQPHVRLSMVPHAETVAIDPPFSTTGYRYRLEGLTGRFDWADNYLTMRRARATHGRTTYAADGTWQILPTGGWQLDLGRLDADRLVFNHDLLLASPPGLRGVLETIQPQGGFDLFHSKVRVVQPAGSGEDLRAEWDLGINCHQANFLFGVPLEGVSGVVRLIGSSDGSSAQTGGELDLDALVWNDLQLTQVRGPIWADSSKVLLGEGASRQLGAKPRRLHANAYGGTVDVNSQVLHGGRPRYGISANLVEVDVARLASEWFQRPESLDGRLNGRLDLEGVGTSIYGLGGRGQLAISDADLYELPVFVRLLKVLRNRSPDQTAFDRCEANFTLRGEQIAFHDLDLLGDAVSLYGEGEATLDRKLNLTFHSIVGRNDMSIPAFRSLLGQASEQLLQLHVIGTTDQPEIRREVLPAVGEMFEQFQANGFGPAPGTEPLAPRSSYTGRNATPVTGARR